MERSIPRFWTKEKSGREKGIALSRILKGDHRVGAAAQGAGPYKIKSLNRTLPFEGSSLSHLYNRQGNNIESFVMIFGMQLWVAEVSRAVGSVPRKITVWF